MEKRSQKYATLVVRKRKLFNNLERTYRANRVRNFFGIRQYGFF